MSIDTDAYQARIDAAREKFFSAASREQQRESCGDLIGVIEDLKRDINTQINGGAQ